MALQIANPAVVAKIERLARRTGLSKTATVERAVDRMLGENPSADETGAAVILRLRSLLQQVDRIPDRPDAFDPLQWDDQGLPR